MNAIIHFCSKFKSEHIIMMLIMLFLGLLMGYAIWHRNKSLLQEAIESKERAENHVAECERALNELKKRRTK